MTDQSRLDTSDQSFDLTPRQQLRLRVVEMTSPDHSIEQRLEAAYYLEGYILGRVKPVVRRNGIEMTDLKVERGRHGLASQRHLHAVLGKTKQLFAGNVREAAHDAGGMLSLADQYGLHQGKSEIMWRQGIGCHVLDLTKFAHQRRMRGGIKPRVAESAEGRIHA